MTDRDPSDVQAELKRAAWEYGKVGLLIDDSRECAARVARALYGSEKLPEWWVLVRSVECACEALSALQEIFADRQFTNLRGLVFIDRYLPARCGDPRAVPWDDESYPLEEGFEGREFLPRMRGIVEKLREGHEKEADGHKRAIPDYIVRFFTSFPALSERGNGGNSSIPWQKRGLEMLQGERRDFLKKRDWRRLLRYGPEADARITRKKAPPRTLLSPQRARRAKWRAKTWAKNLLALSNLLDRVPVVLMTGAGCSLATSPVAPGMPSTDKILAKVCDEMEGGIATENGREWPRLCACNALPPPLTPTEGWSRSKGFPVDWLMAEARQPGGIGRLDWRLEILFSLALHEGGGEASFGEFLRIFRGMLYRTDYGFAYHHWLLARLPWSSLITTNFDGFHERAALAVARIPDLNYEDRFRSLSLGTLWSAEDSKKRPEARGALFKPYGSLYSPDGETILGQEDIEDFRRGFDEAFRNALEHARDLFGRAEAGALVVIGHSMRDDSINQVWKDWWKGAEPSKMQIVWIDPAAYDRCKKDGNFWEARVWERKEDRLREPKRSAIPEGANDLFDKECSGPVPAKAHEFIYDLWALYTLEPEQRRSWF